MKKLLAALAGSLVLAGCGGGQGGFVKACSNGLVKNDYDDAADRKAACACMHGKLDENLSSKQMKIAKHLVAAEDSAILEELATNSKGGEFVAEQLMAAGKECIG
ncbi:MAG: hypothetical protein ACRBEQ_09470 [Hyphomonas sp.]